VIEAIAEIGVPYIDPMDDPDSMRQILEDKDLDKTAKKSGVPLVLGLGSTPGLSNLLAKLGADRLDEVHKVDVSWAFTSVSGTGAGAAVSDHMFHVMDKGWTYRNGKLISIEPLVDGREKQEFMQLGSIKVYDIGHPEPVMLPYAIEGVGEVTCKAGMVPNEMLLIYQTLSKIGFFGLTPVEIKGVSIAPREFLTRHLNNVPMDVWMRLFKFDEFEPIFELRVAVQGEKNGKKKHYLFDFADVAHENGTYTPLALGALMLGRGEIKEAGVFTPESCIDPKPFLRKIIKKGIIPYEIVKGKPESLKL
jgi:saccharopine dehydrogenase (NAD+, L-lysine-forming)